MVKSFEQYEVWFVTGAQLLYGGDAVVQVDAHSKEMVAGLNEAGLPVQVVYKGTANNTHEVADVMAAANNDKRCIGVITWMHTFSPAKMWIHGLQILHKPLLHLHTQYNEKIPYDTMDMDFMNLNQSAHGDREYAHILTRMRKPRKTVIGYWKDPKTQNHIAVWQRVCAGWADAQDCLVLRLGDQMNNVAVTDGDKVAAEQVMGYHVDYCPFSEVMRFFDEVKDEDVTALVHDVYFTEYVVDEALKDPASEAYRRIWNSAKAELTLRALLKAYGAKAFTTNFDDLGDVNVEQSGRGFDQIPGLACQRLMSEGYGFGAEGDWKSAALYRTTWVMSQGLGGSSFLEDYTLNFDGDNTSILESHMLEINPDIAESKPRLEVHFLGIGVRKVQTARLVFTTKQGPGVTATVVDMGNRFRLIVNDVDLIKSKPLPLLPVASALWIPRPSFEVGVGCWMNAGGTHHSCFSFGLTDEYWRDYAEIADMECCIINENTTYEGFRQELRTNEVYYMLNKALR